MPCYEPNVILINHYPETYGQPAKIEKFINSKKHDFLGYEFYEKKNEEFKNSEYDWYREYCKIPCKWCAGCQEKYSKDWATRCMLEASQYEHNYFITLTYDDYNIPRDDYILNRKTGELVPNDNWDQGHLEPDHVVKFMKDLRQYWKYHFHHPKDEIIGYDEEGNEIKPPGIRFFLCGEYGGQTKRPHYHAILFNLPIKKEMLKLHSITKSGDMLWECDTIAKIWGKGFISIAEVNWDTCAYVARYVMKKMKGKVEDEFYFENGMSPEFIRMSRMPGIGLDFFTSNFQKIYANDEIILKGHKEKIQPVKPPSYFDEKFREMHPDEMMEIKEHRKIIAKEQNKLKNMQTSMTEKERLKVEERTKVSKWNTLKRDKI